MPHKLQLLAYLFLVNRIEIINVFLVARWNLVGNLTRTRGDALSFGKGGRDWGVYRQRPPARLEARKDGKSKRREGEDVPARES